MLSLLLMLMMKNELEHTVHTKFLFYIHQNLLYWFSESITKCNLTKKLFVIFGLLRLSFLPPWNVLPQHTKNAAKWPALTNTSLASSQHALVQTSVLSPRENGGMPCTNSVTIWHETRPPSYAWSYRGGWRP